MTLLLTANASAKQLTQEDYQRAEKQLSATTSKLVTGTLDYPKWSNTDDLIYRTNTADGKRFFRVSAKTQKKSLAFDHQKLAFLHLLVAHGLPSNTFHYAQVEIDSCCGFTLLSQQFANSHDNQTI